MSETAIQNEIRNALAEDLGPSGMVLRANVGTAWTGDKRSYKAGTTVTLLQGDVVIRGARPFSTGLPAGFSDLFGIAPRVITQADVGKTIGQFVALEVKTDDGIVSEAQEKFIAAVLAKGGKAGVVRCVDDAREVIFQDV